MGATAFCSPSVIINLSVEDFVRLVAGVSAFEESSSEGSQFEKTINFAWMRPRVRAFFVSDTERRYWERCGWSNGSEESRERRRFL